MVLGNVSFLASILYCSQLQDMSPRVVETEGRELREGHMELYVLFWQLLSLQLFHNKKFKNK